MALLGQWQAEGGVEGGQVLVDADGVVVALPLHIAELRRLPRPFPFPVVPPLLRLLPLAPHYDGKRIDEEDLDDLNDADNRAAHPKAQLAAEVGEKNDELEEKRARGQQLLWVCAHRDAAPRVWHRMPRALPLPPAWSPPARSAAVGGW